MEVTLQVIADELSLSPATVSRSLRHDTTINPQTRARVNEAAQRMGYKPGIGRPRRAVEGETKVRILGLLLRHESLEAAQHDAQLMKMMAGIMSVADQQGMHLKVHTWPADYWPHLDEDPSTLPPMIQEDNCQAIIAHGFHEERNLKFLAQRMPIVSLGRHYRNLPIDAAVADNVDGVHRLVTHLVELGHQRIAWVGANSTWSFIEAREAGFMQGCHSNGLAFHEHSFFGPEIYEGREIHDQAAILAAVEAGVTAFVCGHDRAAFEVTMILKAAGKRVPEDVSITGFDATMGIENMWKPTSINPNFFELGKAAAHLALQRIARQHHNPWVVNVQGEVMIGNTTAPPLGK